MNKKTYKITITIIFTIIILCFLLILYPKIEFKKDNKLYYFSYEEVVDEFEENLCYNESYSYNEKRDISIHTWDVKEFLVFKIHIMEYKEGNVCETEYVLEHSYIEKVIKESTIKENPSNIILSELVKDKEPIVSNTRYPWIDEYYYISYILDDKHEEMYITYRDNLIVIQVGNSDEGPRYIAYK